MLDDALVIARRVKLHPLKRDLRAFAAHRLKDVLAAQRTG